MNIPILATAYLAAGYFFLALFAGAVWAIAFVLVKISNSSTLKKLAQYESDNDINRFEDLLYNAVDKSIASEVTDNKETISNDHEKLMQIYRRHLLKKYSIDQYETMIVPVTVKTIKAIQKDFENGKINEKDAKAEILIIKTKSEHELDTILFRK